MGSDSDGSGEPGRSLKRLPLVRLFVYWLLCLKMEMRRQEEGADTATRHRGERGYVR